MSLSLRSVCVYCGSKVGRDPHFAAHAERLGELLAAAKIRLVYGGGSVGLMGILARATLRHGGEVVGIIPEHLDHVEITQKGLSELHVVPNMHSRKRLMFDHSDAFVSLPGSVGTLDETIEVITWRQLKLHDKPVVLVTDGGYWTPFLDFIDHIIREDFASPATTQLYTVVDTVEEVLSALARAATPKLPDREELI